MNQGTYAGTWRNYSCVLLAQFEEAFDACILPTGKTDTCAAAKYAYVREKADDARYRHLNPYIAISRWWPPGPDRGEYPLIHGYYSLTAC